MVLVEFEMMEISHSMRLSVLIPHNISNVEFITAVIPVEEIQKILPLVKLCFKENDSNLSATILEFTAEICKSGVFTCQKSEAILTDCKYLQYNYF